MLSSMTSVGILLSLFLYFCLLCVLVHFETVFIESVYKKSVIEIHKVSLKPSSLGKKVKELD